MPYPGAALTDSLAGVLDDAAYNADLTATTGNVVLERAIRDVQDSVQQGETLAQPLTQHPVFPPMVVHSMSVGEDTGALDAMLHKI